MTHPIPFSPPDIGAAEEAAVIRVMRSGWLSRGPECSAFESDLAAYCGASHAVSLASCTAALHLALLALGIGKGDTVVTSPLTFVATVNAILYVGARPVFQDVDEDGLLDLGPKSTRVWWPEVKAVIPVDLHGLPCVLPKELPPHVKVIRDAAHSMGAYIPSQQLVASLGIRPRVGANCTADVTCLSFYPTKCLASADGGALLCTDPEVAQRVRRLSQHGMDADAWKRYQPGVRGEWSASEIGYKANMSDIQAAIARVQLQRLPAMLERRRIAAESYTSWLLPLAVSGKLKLPTPRGRGCWYVYAVRIPGGRRDAVKQALSERGIATGVHFKSLSTLPRYQYYGSIAACPNAYKIGEETLSLPFHSRITLEEQERVVRALEELL